MLADNITVLHKGMQKFSDKDPNTYDFLSAAMLDLLVFQTPRDAGETDLAGYIHRRADGDWLGLVDALQIAIDVATGLWITVPPDLGTKACGLDTVAGGLDAVAKLGVNAGDSNGKGNLHVERSLVYRVCCFACAPNLGTKAGGLDAVAELGFNAGDSNSKGDLHVEVKRIQALLNLSKLQRHI
eukprot:gene21700-28724_t